MNNNQKYAKVFMDSLGVEETKLEGLEYLSVSEWDSVGHMGLMSDLEDAFDIMLDTDDIIEFNSFKKGKEILRDNYNISFED